MEDTEAKYRKPIRPEPTRARPGRTKIIDLARNLGLTKGTVSRALNGYSDISEVTRARVKAEAARMGYTPLSHAQAIRTGQVRSLGLVLETSQHDGQRRSSPIFWLG